MNDDQVNDLKQFIAHTVQQTESRIHTDLFKLGAELRTELHHEIGMVRTELRAEIAALRTEMREGFAGVGEAIEIIHEQLEARDRVINARLLRLERGTA